MRNGSACLMLCGALVIVVGCGSGRPWFGGANPDSGRVGDVTADGGAADRRGSMDARGDQTDGGIRGLIKLVPDSKAQLLFALTSDQVLVFDTSTKKEIARVELGATTTDLDLSADGTLLVAAQDLSTRLAVINKQSWTVTYVDVRADPQQVEAASGNVAYYATEDQWTEVHQVDLRYGKAADIKLNINFSEPDIELSADGDSLFVGESASTASSLYNLDLIVAPAKVADKSTWDDDYGFGNAIRHVYLGPSGKYIYFAGHQLDAARLGRALGNIGKVFAEDAAATFAVSERGFIDVALRTVVAPFAKPVAAAALTADDKEVWFYERVAPYDLDGRLAYAPVSDFLAGKTLGVRETSAAEIATYSFSKIVADPVRPRLYGLDPGQSVLVSIDSATGAPLRAAVIEYEAKDVEIDAEGKYIYIGHSGMAVEQIDAATLALVKYIFGPRDSYDIAILGSGRIATGDWDQWTKATIIDTTTDKVLSTAPGFHEGALAATADGKVLFVGNSGTDTDALQRYDVSAGTFLSGMTSGKFSRPARSVVVTPDGTSVYYADGCFNGVNLQPRYQQTDRILSVSPNNVLALSASKIYRVSDGTALMTLSSPCPIQAIAPDSATLFCYDKGRIVKVSLAGLK